jgi:predicted dinucleotide-binding enzyme
MSTAIIGVGNIGQTIATGLVAGGERVVVAARETPHQLAKATASSWTSRPPVPP